MDIGFDEAQMRMAAAAALDHGARPIGAHALGGLDGREQIAAAATQLEHLRAGGHEKAVDLGEAAAVEPAPVAPTVESRRTPLPLGAAFLAEAREVLLIGKGRSAGDQGPSSSNG